MTTKTPKFLRTLYTLLDVESPVIISWSPCGTYFQIYDLARFEQDVLPRYFKHTKFASFQRQLNNFGFRKWTKTRASVCTFSHDTLVRCKPSELPTMLQTTPITSPVVAVVSHKRPRQDDTFTTGLHQKQTKITVDDIELADERESISDVSDLLAMDWSILSSDNKDAAFAEDDDDDDCVGLPIELFFPIERICETIDPLTLSEPSHLDVQEWRLLAECLA